MVVVGGAGGAPIGASRVRALPALGAGVGCRVGTPLEGNRVGTAELPADGWRVGYSDGYRVGNVVGNGNERRLGAGVGSNVGVGVGTGVYGVLVGGDVASAGWVGPGVGFGKGTQTGAALGVGVGSLVATGVPGATGT